jgi:hypothetical protein
LVHQSGAGNGAVSVLGNRLNFADPYTIVARCSSQKIEKILM